MGAPMEESSIEDVAGVHAWYQSWRACEALGCDFRDDYADAAAENYPTSSREPEDERMNLGEQIFVRVRWAVPLYRGWKFVVALSDFVLMKGDGVLLKIRRDCFLVGRECVDFVRWTKEGCSGFAKCDVVELSSHTTKREDAKKKRDLALSVLRLISRRTFQPIRNQNDDDATLTIDPLLIRDWVL